MKKRWILYALVLLVVVFFFGASQVVASPVDVTVAKKTPWKTPGAQATERAIEKANDQAQDEEEDGNGKGNSKGKPVNFKGILVSVGEENLEIKLPDESTITVLVTEETRIHIPTLGKEATVADLKEGVQVALQARENEEGLLIAKSVIVIPGKPTKIHRVGTVTEYLEGESITIEAKDGESYTFALTDDTKILPAARADELEIGVRVTIIAARDVTGGEPIALGIVIHPTKTTDP